MTYAIYTWRYGRRAEDGYGCRFVRNPDELWQLRNIILPMIERGNR